MKDIIVTADKGRLQVKSIAPTLPARPTRKVRQLRWFDPLVKDLDRLVEFRKRVHKLWREIGRWSSEAELDKAEEFVKFEYSKKEVDEMGTMINKYFFPDEEADADNGNLARLVVGELVACYPNAQPPDPEIYVGMLIEEVLASDASVYELESAVRAIRRTKKFLPTVSELLTEIKKAKAEWEQRIDASLDISAEVDALLEKIREERRRQESDKLRRQEQTREGRSFLIWSPE
jgi:hypothetical protein